MESTRWHSKNNSTSNLHFFDLLNSILFFCGGALYSCSWKWTFITMISLMSFELSCRHEVHFPGLHSGSELDASFYHKTFEGVGALFEISIPNWRSDAMAILASIPQNWCVWYFNENRQDVRGPTRYHTKYVYWVWTRCYKYKEKKEKKKRRLRTSFSVRKLHICGPLRRLVGLVGAARVK